jgi:hypothetical protein
MSERIKTANHETRANEQDKSEGDLYDNQNGAQFSMTESELPASAAAGKFLKKIAANGMKGWG